MNAAMQAYSPLEQASIFELDYKNIFPSSHKIQQEKPAVFGFFLVKDKKFLRMA